MHVFSIKNIMTDISIYTHVCRHAHDRCAVLLYTLATCLPTPLTLVSGGSPMIPLVVHQPAYPSIWPAAASLLQRLPTNPVVCMWVQLKRWCVSCVDVTGGIVVMDVFWRRLYVRMI